MIKKIYSLIIISFLLYGCVTKVVNSDGTVENKVQDNKKLSDVYTDLAIEYQKRGAPQIALDRANLAIATNSNNAKAYSVRAMIYQNLNQFIDATNDFKKSLKLSGDAPEYFVNYAVFLCARQEYDLAFKDFDAAINNPLYYSPEIAYYNKGKCLYQKGDFSLANENFLKALSYKNPPPDAYVALAQLQLKNNNYQSANYYINKYNANQTSLSLWVHIQALNGLINTSKDPSVAKQSLDYNRILADMLVKNFGNSKEAQLYINTYGMPAARVNTPKIFVKNTFSSAKVKTINKTELLKSNRRIIKVKSDDTLVSIAKKNNISIEKLKTINKLKHSKIKVGQKIYLD